jgi:hypothetical protein
LNRALVGLCALCRSQQARVLPASSRIQQEGEAKLVSPITMENIADAVLDAGLASRADVDQVIVQLYELARDPRTVMSIPRVVQAWGYNADVLP